MIKHLVKHVAGLQLQNRGIGNNNQLLFSNQQDWRRVKALVRGCVIVMGGNTMVSMKYRPVPECDNIVLTTTRKVPAEFIHLTNLEEAKRYAQSQQKTLYIFGGQRLYEESMNDTTGLELTFFTTELPFYHTLIPYKPSDTFYPAIPTDFHVEHESEWVKADGYYFKYVSMSRGEVRTKESGLLDTIC